MPKPTLFIEFNPNNQRNIDPSSIRKLKRLKNTHIKTTVEPGARTTCRITSKPVKPEPQRQITDYFAPIKPELANAI